MNEYNYDFLDLLSKESNNRFYILNVDRLKCNYTKMLSEFRKYYAETYIAYSYKTNYLPVVVFTIDSMGGYAEVVSDMEYAFAKKVVRESRKIFFNGPIKSELALYRALDEGANINVDSFVELDKIINYCSEKKRKYKVGLRCAIDIGQDCPSRFGFETNDDLNRAIEMILQSGYLELSGLHFHLPYRDLDSFQKRIIAIESVFETINYNMFEYVSIGGGWMGEIDSKSAQFMNIKPSYYSEYAGISARGMQKLFQKYSIAPKLILEPGSALVADALQYVCKVESIKKSRNTIFATLTGSTHDINPSVRGVNRPISIYSRKDGKEYDSVKMVGYTCIEGDCLFDAFSGKLSEGDYVVFDNVGSYSITMKAPFILPMANIYSIDSGDVMLEAKEQSTEEIFASLGVLKSGELKRELIMKINESL